MTKWKLSTVVLALVLVVILTVGFVLTPAKVEVTRASWLESARDVTTQSADLSLSPGGYEVVPLVKDWINVAAVQMNPKGVDTSTPATIKKSVKENVDHMLELCDAAFYWPPGHKDLLVFPEFSLTGFEVYWTRADWLNIAISVPGPETERIGEKAKALNCYIAFGAHTTDPDWPGHFFNCSVIIGPDGEVILTHWKAYGGFPGIGIEYSTTVHDVLDEFVDRYGWDAVWPVARTPIGNLSSMICSESFAPETARAFAFNGMEILIRCIAGAGPGLTGYDPGKHIIQFQAQCAASGVYGVSSNCGAWKTPGRLTETAGGGGSVIVGPDGRILVQALDTREQVITASIPIAHLRARHRIPNIRTELYVPGYEQHPGQYPPNLYTLYEDEYGYLPPDIGEARRWSLEHARY